MKKIISLLLAFCLLLSMTAGALAANWTPTVDKTTVKAGEEVKVTVSLDEPMTDITTVGYDLYFDDELFTYKEDSFTISEELAAERYLLPEISAKLSDATGNYHSLNFINPKECFDISAGEVCSLIFVANADLQADAAGSFTLKLVAVLDDFYEEVSGHGAGAAVSVSVTPAEKEPETGAVIPAGAPFTALTTDKGAAIAIEDKGMSGDYTSVSFGNSYGSAPYYHVTLPEGASSVSVTYPAEQDPFVTTCGGTNVAYGYYADVTTWSGGNMEISGYTQNDDGSTTIAFPVAIQVMDWSTNSTYDVSFLLDEDGSGNAAAVERNDYSPIAFFSFSYEEEEPSCSHSETSTAYAPVAGEEKHTVTVTCKACSETVGEVTTEPCKDENGDQQCDKCGGTVLPAGYYVSLSEDKAVSIGETVNLEISVGNSKEEHYNAYYLTVSYDDSILTYTGTAAGIADNGEGLLTIAGYGDNKACATDTISLSFEAIGIGEAAVSITTANIDKSANANSQNAPEAAIVDGSATVTVGGYTVSLSDDFTGEGTVGEDEDYNFEAKDKNYNYEVTAKIGEDKVEVTDNGDGSFTIPADQINGNLVITSSKTPKSYDVTVSGNAASEVSAAETATYGTDYSFTVSEDGVSTYTVTVKVGGQDFIPTRNGSSYTIPGASVTGKIEITVSKVTPVPTTTSISFSGEGSADVVGGTTQTAANGQDFSFRLNKAEGYTYTVKLNGQELQANADGSYTIPGSMIGGTALSVTVEKVVDQAITVAVSEYITVDESVLWLVTASGAPEGTVLGYNGSAMYWSDKYEAHAWLVFSAESEASVLAAAQAAVAEVSADKVSLNYNMDVNGTKLVDINDAQTVYNMYKAQYANFESVSVASFLEADVNGSKSINVDDAAAIINAILNS